MPANDACPFGFASPLTMPTTSPSRLNSGPPELPGFTDASNWMSSVIGLSAPGGCTLRCSPEITPVDRLRLRPNGFPMTIASSPTFSAFALPSVATAIGSGWPRARMPAMSLSGWRAKTFASYVEPSLKVTVIRVASLTTCSAVRMSASSSKITPLPSALPVREVDVHRDDHRREPRVELGDRRRWCRCRHVDGAELDILRQRRYGNGDRRGHQHRADNELDPIASRRRAQPRAQACPATDDWR